MPSTGHLSAYACFMQPRGDRTRTLILATVLVLSAHTEALSDKFRDYRGGGGGFIGETNRKLGKDYYVVREGANGKCSIQAGDFGENPKDMVGGAPYASKDYAKAALEKSPECKGGEADEAMDHREKGGKNQRKESGAVPRAPLMLVPHPPFDLELSTGVEMDAATFSASRHSLAHEVSCLQSRS